jgi:hypothetical protein
MDGHMSWRVLCASEIGTSHVKGDIPCQDACLCEVVFLPNGQPLLTLWVSDGAGSAIYGGEGAKLAINAAQLFLKEKIKVGEFGLSDDLAVELIKRIHQIIDKEAQNLQLKPRDYACTFIGIISSIDCTLALQIGDGAVAINVGDDLELAIEPASGEYVNMTYFVTDDDSIQNLQTKIYPNKATQVAAFSDGLQHLALNLSKKTVHKPFFTPFFHALQTHGDDKLEMLEGALRSFLDSEGVNERTDDDKTLALAIWTEPQ